MSSNITDQVVSTENKLSAKITQLSAKAEADITQANDECVRSHQMNLESIANLQKILSEFENTSKASVFKDSLFLNLPTNQRILYLNFCPLFVPNNFLKKIMCHKDVTPSKTKDFLKSPCFYRS